MFLHVIRDYNLKVCQAMFKGFVFLSKRLTRKAAPFLIPQKRQLGTNQNQMATAEPRNKTCSHLVWMDLEMTGLDVQRDKILEVAVLITDKDLNIICEGLSLAIKQPKEVLDNMNEWCVKHHNESGLVQKCLESQITTDQAECMILKFLQENIPKKECPLAGNSVYMDRLFLRLQMPEVDDYLHYRIVDVSTIKELFKRWMPEIAEVGSQKKLAHRSLDDIKESIAELRHYRKFFVMNDKN